MPHPIMGTPVQTGRGIRHGLARGEQRSKVLPASQGEQEGQDDGETL